jgi:rubredoxin
MELAGMNDIVITLLIAVVAVAFVLGVVILFPFHLYNVAWRAIKETHPIIPVFLPGHSTSGRDGYYKLSGAAPKVYGVFCLIFGLSMQIFALDIAWNIGNTSYATFTQKIEVWVWLVCLFPVSFSAFWVPSASATSERTFKESHELFFWKGIWKLLKAQISIPKRSLHTSRRKNMEDYIQPKTQDIPDRIHTNCFNCEMEGYIDIPDINSSYLLQCTQCNLLDSYMVCRDCETGGSYVDNLHEQPDTWTCPDCGRKRKIQKDFYNKVIPILKENA